MNPKRVFLLLILILVIVLLFLLFFTENFIRRSIGKAITSTSTSLIIKPKPTEEGVVPQIGGGGASPTKKGVVPSPKSDFIVDPNLIRVVIKQGESQGKTVRIINTGDTTLEINVELGDLKRFIAIDTQLFSLEVGKSKIINLDLFAGENEIPGVYTGRIAVQGNGITKMITIVIEVKERKPLFNITTEVIEKKLRPNDEVWANIRIINMGDLEDINVLLYYAIKTFGGDILLSKEESLTIDKKLDIKRSLKIPQTIHKGEYLFYSKVSYEDIFAESADTFEVTSEEVPAPIGKGLFNTILLLIMLGLIVIILVLYTRIRKVNTRKRKAKGYSKKD